MMEVRFSAASVFLALFLFQQASLAQEQKAAIHRNGKVIEWYHEDANYHPNTLLFKVLQFTAPYPGFYQKLSVNRNGDAFTARIVPDWAVQGSKSAKLEGALSDQIGQMLAQLDLTSDSLLPEPEPDQCRTALVFYDGKAYKRYDFNGALPVQVELILDLIRAEVDRQARLQNEELLERHRMIKETYGDWQNIKGVAVPGGSRMRSLKETRGLLLTLTGHRKPTLPADASEVSIYHALIFYPDGRITGSAGGGRLTDDPLSIQGVVWDVPMKSGSGAVETDKKVLEIEYQAIDGTVSVGGKAYQLGFGNIFIIRMNETWTPIVSQIEVHLDEQRTEQRVLDGLKSILRYDEAIQRLELN